MTAPQRKKLLVTLAVLTIGILVVDQVILGPLGRAWSARAERIGQLRRSIAEGEQLMERKETLTERWKALQEASLPLDRTEAERLVDHAANRWGDRSGLNFRRTKNWVDQDETHRLYKRTVEGAEGDPESVIRLLHAIETDPLPLHAETITITSLGSDGDRIKLDLNLSGLQIIEEGRLPHRPAGTTEPPEGLRMEDFSLVNENNIFDGGRRERQPPRPPPRGEPDWFTLVGTMQDGRRRLAFFKGSSSSYPAVLEKGGIIVDFTVESVELEEVVLAREEETFCLTVGTEMRRPPDQDWALAEPGERGRPSPGAGGETGEAEDSAPSGGDDVSEIMRRMMEARNAE